MKDYFEIDDVYMAILETNGSLSVIPKAGARPPTADEAGIKSNQQTLPHVIIADGKNIPNICRRLASANNGLKSN